MSTTLSISEDQHRAGWLKQELLGYGSRTVRTVKGGQNLKTGTVIGRIMTSGTATAAATVGTGNGVMGAITVTAPALTGVYKLTITRTAANAGDFEVEGPDGKIIGYGA